MGVGSQLLAILRAPAALLGLRANALRWLMIYLLAATLLLTVVGALIVLNQQSLRQTLLAYLLPQNWLFAGDRLIGYMFAQQSKTVLINAAASGTLVMISLLLFPIKERLSATYERENELLAGDHHEFPLWFQGLEEVKLALLYATAFMTIFWIGYHPHPTRKLAAAVLSYAFLFFSFAVDFIAPVLQRRRLHYSRIIKCILKHPLACFGFGALFAAPSVLAGLYLKAHPELSLFAGILALFSANVLGIICAAVAGTWLGAQLYPAALQTNKPHPLTRALISVFVALLLVANCYVFGSLGVALHRKSQILKCDYSVDLSTLRVEWPSKSKGGGFLALVGKTVDTLLSGTLNLRVSTMLTIKNPTEFDVELEQNRVEIHHDDQLIGTTRLSTIRVPAGQTISTALALSLQLNPRFIVKGRRLLTDRWRVTLYLRIAPNFDFPIYLVKPGSAER
ncbi:MAG: hypothetical protein H6707_05035 [Deltaproteobacteria bacterium]|nr:hypothetical protein [Deltaproteobacteria bacterium]